jgi:hypothetical protein
MRAFKVELNGKRLCVAGVGAKGVLTAIASYVGNAARGSTLDLHVGGLYTKTREHATWANIGLKVGDRVMLRVVETDSVDKPKKRYRADPKAEDKSQKAYVRAWAKKFGWTISKKKKPK